jgi:hypothetical protein
MRKVQKFHYNRLLDADQVYLLTQIFVDNIHMMDSDARSQDDS